MTGEEMLHPSRLMPLPVMNCSEGVPEENSQAAAVAAQAEPMPAASMMVKNVFFIILNRVDRQLVEGNIQNLPFHAKPIPDL